MRGNRFLFGYLGYDYLLLLGDEHDSRFQLPPRCLREAQSPLNALFNVFVLTRIRWRVQELHLALNKRLHHEQKPRARHIVPEYEVKVVLVVRHHFLEATEFVHDRRNVELVVRHRRLNELPVRQIVEHGHFYQRPVARIGIELVDAFPDL